ncbi:MAG TPA: cobalamin-independent methionine synthase II family protein [Methylomirabilota bacterium]|jgi:5-methyltetrahydropteroyltriglutamate--homocysteine methyltransferase|nr:cobalamin-independent methionine synthase II family protein [Methylomirabilota bacterium]
MLNATRDLVLPTTITGSYPRPHWFTEELRGRGFKDALGDSRFREQYLDAVACLVREQEMAGLDFVTDGDSRFDLTVGGKSWFYYVIERLGGITGAQDRSTGGGWKSLRPGHILYEVMEAYQPAVVGAKLAGGALQYAALFKTAQRLASRPVKFGAITAQSLAKMLVDRHYGSDRDVILALADIFNAELKEVAAAGCRVIQVEEPQHHIAGALGASDKDLEFYTESVNREIAGVNTEIWLHTCWGNPNQQPLHWERPSYERSLPYLLATNADVLTLECASTGGRDLPLLGRHRTDKKIAIGVVNHSTAAVEPPEVVANLIRKALEYVPPERLILSTDCGFGREGLARRIAFYKSVAINLGANIVRRELKLPEVEIPAADPRFTFAG